MKRILVAALLALSLTPAFGQIQRWETAPGVYENVKTPNYGSITWLASAARTTTQTLADQTNTQARGIIVYCNVTVAPGVETLTLSVQEKDPLSAVYQVMAANTATTATGIITLRVYPDIAVVAASATGQTAQNILPGSWRLVMTHSAGSSWTYSCSYQLLQQ